MHGGCSGQSGNRSEKTHDLFTAEVCLDEEFTPNEQLIRTKISSILTEHRRKFA